MVAAPRCDAITVKVIFVAIVVISGGLPSVYLSFLLVNFPINPLLANIYCPIHNLVLHRFHLITFLSCRARKILGWPRKDISWTSKVTACVMNSFCYIFYLIWGNKPFIKMRSNLSENARYHLRQPRCPLSREILPFYYFHRSSFTPNWFGSLGPRKGTSSSRRWHKFQEKKRRNISSPGSSSAQRLNWFASKIRAQAIYFVRNYA